MLKCCFDTSALNNLLDDEERATLVSHYQVLPTSVNIVEIVSTREEERRKTLLALLRSITGNFRPLAMPNKLIWRAIRAYARRSTSITVTITDEDAAFWHLIDDPNTAGDQERNEALAWKTELENGFTDSHRSARGDFQELFAQNPSERPSSLVELIRTFGTAKNGVIYKQTRKIYKNLTNQNLSYAGFIRMMERMPDWPIYLASWGHPMLARAIQRENFGIKGRPGTLDLWCANYLPYCDVFVTHDVGQYKALRLLSRFIKPTVAKATRVRVVRYERLRRELLASSRWVTPSAGG